MNEKIFFYNLSKSSFVIRYLIKEHINYYEDFFNHVFLGDLVRFLEGGVDEKDSFKLISTIFNIINDSFNYGDLPLRNLISVSFLENLYGLPKERIFFSKLEECSNGEFLESIRKIKKISLLY